jgi:thiazole biosynthesis/tRNA modification protein ThiI
MTKPTTQSGISKKLQRKEIKKRSDATSPQKQVWMVRYSEVFLKSDPVRRKWERTIVNSIKEVLPNAVVRDERGRIWVEGEVNPEKLKKIFGIFSFSHCDVVNLNFLSEGLVSFCENHNLSNAKSFALRIRRIGEHTFSSRDVAVKYGEIVRNHYPHLKVDLNNPDKEIHIEIRDDICFLYDSVEQGAGGIPSGVEGMVVALVSGGIDSPVAAYMMMKRGCKIIPLYVGLDGFLDETNLARTETVMKTLRDYQPDIELLVVKDSFLLDAHKELEKKDQERYTCLICKRRMYRIAAEVARRTGAKGFVTGEAMGQVASQTLDNLAVLTDAAAIPVYRPLIGFDKEDVIQIARRIGTFEPSIASASGCGAVPDKPSTAASIEIIREIEKRIIDLEEDMGNLSIIPAGEFHNLQMSMKKS